MTKITCLKDMKSQNKKWPISKQNSKASEIIIYDIWNLKSTQFITCPQSSPRIPIQTLSSPQVKPIQTLSSPQVKPIPYGRRINEVKSSIHIDMNKTCSLNSDEKIVLKKLLSRSNIDVSSITRDYEILGNRINRLMRIIERT